MFNLLDAALASMLNDTAMRTTLVELFNADVSFVTPAKAYSPAQETINLFLYETKENRVLRDAVPIEERRNGTSVRRRPPLRVDCSYLVTAWSKKTGADRVAAEHRLLGQALLWLSRFPDVPETHLVAAGLSPQPFPPPTLVAQMDGMQGAGEFWHALGIPPRPYFTVVATIALDLRLETVGALVTTSITGYHPGMTTPDREERVAIGGTVFDTAGVALTNVWVRLEPGDATTVTDGDGRFIFQNVKSGMTYTLRARAVGLGEATRSNVDVSIPTRDYNVQF